MIEKIFIRETKEEKGTFEYWCPGCEKHHFVNRKIWNINLESNTIHPSVLTKSVNSDRYWQKDINGEYVIDSNNKVVGSVMIKCHCFVRNGKIEYLNDCTHSFKGQTIPMVELK